VLLDPVAQAMSDGSLLRRIERRLPGHGARVVDVYRARMSNAAPWEIFSAIETDRVFRAPAWKLAQARLRSGQATHLYAFDFTGPLFGSALGACHTIEVPFSFGLVHEGFGKVFSGAGPDARLLSDRMLDAWMSFVRSGDPSTESLGAWPGFEAAEPKAMRLGREPGLQPALQPELDALWDELI
jgi:para-nitrobenzyl esterase